MCALQDFKQTLKNYHNSTNFTEIDPLITRLLIAANSGVKLYVLGETNPLTKHVEFLVFLRY